MTGVSLLQSVLLFLTDLKCILLCSALRGVARLRQHQRKLLKTNASCPLKKSHKSELKKKNQTNQKNNLFGFELQRQTRRDSLGQQKQQKEKKKKSISEKFSQF
uniref:Secreted protein n=1 Tax=Poecilia reticulata TaxID=8081 RepID=A0A3P9QHX3_POERE